MSCSPEVKRAAARDRKRKQRAKAQNLGVKEVSVRPFLFDSFISALSRIDSTSRLLKRDSKHDIYRIRVTSPYGEYRAIYLKMDSNTIKFVRFGQRDSIYQELDACGWSFD